MISAHHVESCQETVPQAITGSIAEAFYGMPEDLKQECRQRLIPELESILLEWEKAAL